MTSSSKCFSWFPFPWVRHEWGEWIAEYRYYPVLARPLEITGLRRGCRKCPKIQRRRV